MTDMEADLGVKETDPRSGAYEIDYKTSSAFLTIGPLIFFNEKLLTVKA